MTKYLDLEGLRKFKEQADAAYLLAKGTIPLTGSINLTTESVASLGLKYAKVANNSLNFYVIADSSGKLPSSETRININSSITSLVGAEGANVGDIFVVGKLDLKPVYKVIPLNDAKAANGSYAGTNGIMTPWDKARVNKVDSIEGTANNALNRANNALNNLPTLTETNMNNALQTGVYPWCTLGRPNGSTGAYTCITIHTTTKDGNGFDTIEQTAYGRQGELGKVYKRTIFKSDSETQFGDWIKISNEAFTTKKKNTKTQYIIGKAIPIGKLDGGARLNAYVARFGNFRFKLSKVPQLRALICSDTPSWHKVVELLKGVTWHLFIDNMEIYTGAGSVIHGGGVMHIFVNNNLGNTFFKLDESKSSVDLSSDMYIYLRTVSPIKTQNCTSKTLFYYKNDHKLYRIWKPAFESPFIEVFTNKDGSKRSWLRNTHSGYVQIQRLHTRQQRSRLAGSKTSFDVRKYRGNFGSRAIPYYGIYRYRLVKNGKKTQWRTISLMNNEEIRGEWNIYSIK